MDEDQFYRGLEGYDRSQINQFLREFNKATLGSNQDEATRREAVQAFVYLAYGKRWTFRNESVRNLTIRIWWLYRFQNQEGESWQKEAWWVQQDKTERVEYKKREQDVVTGRYDEPVGPTETTVQRLALDEGAWNDGIPVNVLRDVTLRHVAGTVVKRLVVPPPIKVFSRQSYTVGPPLLQLRNRQNRSIERQGWSLEKQDKGYIPWSDVPEWDAFQPPRKDGRRRRTWQRGPHPSLFGLSSKLRLATQMADVLACLHDQVGMVHLHVDPYTLSAEKPFGYGNMYEYDQPHPATLRDLKSARFVASRLQDGKRVHEPIYIPDIMFGWNEYSAPEIKKAATKQTPVAVHGSADVWSLALCILELVTHLPIPETWKPSVSLDTWIQDTFDQHRPKESGPERNAFDQRIRDTLVWTVKKRRIVLATRERVPIYGKLWKRLKDILSACLDPDPMERPRMAAVAHELAEVWNESLDLLPPEEPLRTYRRTYQYLNRPEASVLERYDIQGKNKAGQAMKILWMAHKRNSPTLRCRFSANVVGLWNLKAYPKIWLDVAQNDVFPYIRTMPQVLGDRMLELDVMRTLVISTNLLVEHYVERDQWIAIATVLWVTLKLQGVCVDVDTILKAMNINGPRLPVLIEELALMYRIQFRITVPPLGRFASGDVNDEPRETWIKAQGSIPTWAKKDRGPILERRRRRRLTSPKLGRVV